MTRLIELVSEEELAGIGQLLPKAFAENYEALWIGCFADGGSGGGVRRHPLDGRSGELGRASGKIANGGWRLSSGTRDVYTNRRIRGRSFAEENNVLRNEGLFRYKEKVDKRLRQIAREMVAVMEGRNRFAAGHRICTGRCGKFGDWDWTFCARCGGPMREMEENE